MDGWRATTIDEACNVEYGTRAVQKRDGGSIYPVYGGGGATFFMDTTNRANRVVVSRFGMSEVCTRYVNGEFFLNDSGLTLSPKDAGTLLPKFLDRLTLALNDEIFALGKGAAQKNLDVPAFRDVRITYPVSLSEQRRIVAIVDETFEGIATAKANAEKNMQNARELFENVLQATINAEAQSWPTQPLGTLCTQVTDGTHNSPLYVESGVPMLDSKHIGDGFEIDNSKAEKFIAPEVDAQLAQRCKPREGDILISSRGTIGKIAIVRAGQDFNIMGNMILLRLPRGVDRHFIAFYVLSRVAHIESIARGVAQKGLYLGQVRDYQVPVPPLDEQRRLASMLLHLQVESARLGEVINRKLAALDELKKSLLHQAFTGALSAEAADRLVAEVA